MFLLDDLYFYININLFLNLLIFIYRNYFDKLNVLDWISKILIQTN